MSNRIDQLRVEVVGDELIVILPATSYGITYYKPANSSQLLAKEFRSKVDSGAPLTYAGSRSCLAGSEQQGARAGVDCVTTRNVTDQQERSKHMSPTWGVLSAGTRCCLKN